MHERGCQSFNPLPATSKPYRALIFFHRANITWQESPLGNRESGRGSVFGPNWISHAVIARPQQKKRFSSFCPPSCRSVAIYYHIRVLTSNIMLISTPTLDPPFIAGKFSFSCHAIPPSLPLSPLVYREKCPFKWRFPTFPELSRRQVDNHQTECTANVSCCFEVRTCWSSARKLSFSLLSYFW